VKLTTLAIFAAGYVLGARAGRERYVEIVEIVERASQRLEEFSARHPPTLEVDGAGRRDRDPRSQGAPL
jgi:hypothetical protein